MQLGFKVATNISNFKEKIEQLAKHLSQAEILINEINSFEFTAIINGQVESLGKASDILNVNSSEKPSGLIITLTPVDEGDKEI